MKVKIKRLYPNARHLTRGSHLAAGWDVYATLPTIVHARRIAKVPLGIALEIEPGWFAQVNPRSGLAAKGIEVSIGTIDADYRGEIMAIVKNHTTESYTICDGDKIAQLVFLPVPTIEWEEVTDLSLTQRGEAGFGSTGI